MLFSSHQAPHFGSYIPNTCGIQQVVLVERKLSTQEPEVDLYGKVRSDSNWFLSYF